MLVNSTVATIVHMRLQTIPLAMTTTRKSIHGFAFLSYMSMWHRLAALQIELLYYSLSLLISLG